MSNIIKKITKKYKWLRFLNYKTTKLAVLSAALFGLCLSSGASFAKYRDENYGNGNAGIATMGDVVVTYHEEGIDPTIQLPKLGSLGSESGWHAFLATIKVQFFNVEVKYNFTMNFKISNQSNTKYSDASNVQHTSFALPNTVSNPSAVTTYVKSSSTSEAVEKEVVTAKAESMNNEFKNGWEKFNINGNIENDTVYYAVEKSNNESEISSNLSFGTSSWHSQKLDVSTSGLTLSYTTVAETVLPSDVTTIYFYKMLFFVYFEATGNKVDTEMTKIFYELNGEQVQ